MERVTIRKKKKKKKLRLFISLILLVILVGVGIGFYVTFQAYQAANKTYDELDRGEKSDLREEVVTISKDPISILLMGVEDYTTGGTNGRSDTLMVATFNPNDEKLKLLSIPRDSYVDIPGEGMSKINHSFAWGGKELTIQTVENLLNIPIDYYATVNFDGFKNIVDTLGGITVDVPFDFKQNSDDRKAEKLEFYEGEMELDGRYALAYARMRLEDPRGDIGRNERQQQVIEAIIQEMASVSTITKIDDLATDLSDNIETNLKFKDGLNFLKKYHNFRTSNIDNLTFDGVSDYLGNVSYYFIDEESLNEIQHELRVHLELEEPEAYTPETE
jgi:polyisoprenyl-teichoic acid--peptidoglycan teichoic acid transferase